MKRLLYGLLLLGLGIACVGCGKSSPQGAYVAEGVKDLFGDQIIILDGNNFQSGERNEKGEYIFSNAGTYEQDKDFIVLEYTTHNRFENTWIATAKYDAKNNCITMEKVTTYGLTILDKREITYYLEDKDAKYEEAKNVKIQIK